ncbi:putative DNA polymerase beta-like domain, DNA polymerase lambda lyase domain superfamily [Plasmopara halstedii]
MIHDDFAQIHQHLDSLRVGCQQSGLSLPKNVYKASVELITALLNSNGNEEVALKLLTSRLHSKNKREHDTITEMDEIKQAGQSLSEIGNVKETPEEDEVGNKDGLELSEEPPRKISRLTADVLKKSAAVDSNKVLVNVLADYGDQHIRQGHTGKGVAQLRAARAIRDYPHPVTSAADARAIRSVGPKMATRIEHILSAEKLDVEVPKSNHIEKFELPKLIQEIQSRKAMCPENQKLVDELAYFGEHELLFRSVSKGMTHLRAARALQLADQVTTSGSQARHSLAIGPAIADKIDQILKYGRIVKDSVSIPIVEDLRLNPAKEVQNQPLVDALADYGSSHLHSGHAGKGIAHLRAAKAIRDADIVIKSGAHAISLIKKVNAMVAAKIDQVLKEGHADTEEEDDDSQDEAENEFGAREPPDTPLIVHEVRSKPAQIEENQKIVNALSTRGEMQLAKWHTGQGTAFMRAARRLRDAAEVVTNGTVAKALGRIGDKVGAFIDGIMMEDQADTTEELNQLVSLEGSSCGCSNGDILMSTSHTYALNGFIYRFIPPFYKGYALVETRINMTDAKTANAVYAQIGKLREMAMNKNVDIPENPYVATHEIATALLASNGDDQGALKKVMAKFGRNKRSLPAEANQNSKKSKRAGDGNEPAFEASGYQDNGEDSMPPHKTVRLVEEVREKKAVNSANQKIVDAFADYGDYQLNHGHTGKGVSHLRAALHIRDHPDAIKSAKEARSVPMVGDKLAAQIDEVIKTGRLTDETGDQNISTDVDNHQRPELVVEIHNSQAKRPENQQLVQELTKFGEHELYFGSPGKGTTHLRAAREIQLTDQVIKSGSIARTKVPLVGDVIADKIDQILEYGRIIKDTGETTGSRSYSRGSGGGYVEAPIVKDLRENPAKCPENQPIVDALVDYGDSHLYSGHRGKGISHLRAAQSIRDSETIVKSGQQASKEIGMVGKRIAAKIDQIVEQGHADSDEDYEYDAEEEDNGYGERDHDSVVPPIVQDVTSKPAQVEKNQVLVNALVEYGEEELYKRHTGRGTAFLRAARRLRDADTLVSNGQDAKKLGRIGDKVAQYLDTILAT